MATRTKDSLLQGMLEWSGLGRTIRPSPWFFCLEKTDGGEGSQPRRRPGMLSGSFSHPSLVSSMSAFPLLQLGRILAQIIRQAVPHDLHALSGER